MKRDQCQGLFTGIALNHLKADRFNILTVFLLRSVTPPGPANPRSQPLQSSIDRKTFKQVLLFTGRVKKPAPERHRQPSPFHSGRPAAPEYCGTRITFDLQQQPQPSNEWARYPAQYPADGQSRSGQQLPGGSHSRSSKILPNDCVPALVRTHPHKPQFRGLLGLPPAALIGAPSSASAYAHPWQPSGVSAAGQDFQVELVPGVTETAHLHLAARLQVLQVFRYGTIAGHFFKPLFKHGNRL